MMHDMTGPDGDSSEVLDLCSAYQSSNVACHGSDVGEHEINFQEAIDMNIDQIQKFVDVWNVECRYSTVLTFSFSFSQFTFSV